MALDLHIENNAICKSILEIISKLRDQIYLSWQLSSIHSKFVGHSTEIFWQSKIKGTLASNQKTLRFFQTKKLILNYQNIPMDI